MADISHVMDIAGLRRGCPCGKVFASCSGTDAGDGLQARHGAHLRPDDALGCGPLSLQYLIGEVFVPFRVRVDVTVISDIGPVLGEVPP